MIFPPTYRKGDHWTRLHFLCVFSARYIGGQTISVRMLMKDMFPFSLLYPNNGHKIKVGLATITVFPIFILRFNHIVRRIA